MKPGEVLPENVNLAEVTLRRGYELFLPTAQMLAATMAGRLGVTLVEILMPSSKIHNTPTGDLDQLMVDNNLHNETPLWLYTLREAEVVSQLGGTGL